MRIILMLILAVAGVKGADLQGGGNNPLRNVKLDEATSLEFFAKPGDDTLYFRISIKEGEGSSTTISPGTGVPTGKSFVYFWDDALKTFWFADERFLQKFDLSQKGKTSTTTYKAGDRKGVKDMPAGMVSLVEGLTGAQ